MNSILDEIPFDVVMESEYNVISALLDAYDKAYVILENCDDENVDSFDLFQEQTIFTEWKHGSQNKNQSRKTTKQMIQEQPGFVPDKPKFKFRQTKKNGKKESIIRSIWKMIPRLYHHAQELHNHYMQKKRLRYINSQANRLGVDVKHMSTGQLELFYTICNQTMPPDELKKQIKKANNAAMIKHSLIKAGLKVGTGAIVVGGIAYELKHDGSLVRTAVDNFKGKINKKLDDAVLSKIRDTGEAAVNKINEAGQQVIKLIKQAMNKAIEFIKKMIASIKKFFNINVLGYDKTSDDTIICKFDPTDGTFYVTLDLDIMDEYIKKSDKFISAAAKMIALYIDDGKLVNNPEHKRTGVLVDFDRDKFNEKNPIKKSALPDAAKASEMYNNDLKELFSKTKKKCIYNPLSQFTEKSQILSESITKYNKTLDQLITIYQKRVDEQETSDKASRWDDAEKSVLNTLRGIMDVQINLLNAIGAINEYIENLFKMAEEMSVNGDD